MSRKVLDTDPRRKRAIAMRRAGATRDEIRARLGLRDAILLRWIKGVPRGEQPSLKMTPAPYARGYRVGWGRWM